MKLIIAVVSNDDSHSLSNGSRPGSPAHIFIPQPCFRRTEKSVRRLFLFRRAGCGRGPTFCIFPRPVRRYSRSI